MPRRYDTWVMEEKAKEVSKWKTYNFFPGDVISLNYGFGQKNTGTITYINPTHDRIIVNGTNGKTCHGIEEPWISQVRFITKSPERQPEMRLTLMERFALWLLNRTGFFNKTGHEQVVTGMRLYTYKVGR